jgi:hypothetical protein
VRVAGAGCGRLDAALAARIALLAVPILIQVYFNAGLAYWLNRRLGAEWCVAGPSALIGACNFFELAVATTIALLGLQSGAALASVVGVLVEVPVMLSRPASFRGPHRCCSWVCLGRKRPECDIARSVACERTSSRRCRSNYVIKPALPRTANA